MQMKDFAMDDRNEARHPGQQILPEEAEQDEGQGDHTLLQRGHMKTSMRSVYTEGDGTLCFPLQNTPSRYLLCPQWSAARVESGRSQQDLHQQKVTENFLFFPFGAENGNTWG